MRPSAKELLAKIGYQAMIITNPINIRYLCTFSGGNASLLVTKKGYALFVDVLEYEAAVKHAPSFVRVQKHEKILSAFQGITKCAFEEHHIVVARLKKWKKMFPHCQFIGLQSCVEEYRRTKDANELKKIVRANAITEDILSRIPLLLQAGVTEKEVAWRIECWAHEQGADGVGFPTIVAFGTNTSRPHHHPTNKKLKKTDIIQIDMGFICDGYTSDRSAVYFVGKPTAQQTKVHSILEEAKRRGIEAVAPGVACSEPDRIVRTYLQEQGFDQYFIHSLGHGVGLEVHEGVSLSSRSNDVLQEYEVVTIEPGIYFEGKWGMRLEDMVVVQ